MTDNKIIKLVDNYTKLAAAAKAASEAADAAREALLDLGDGSYVGTLTKATVSTSIPVRFDSGAFKEAHPSLWEQFRRQGDPVTSVRIHGR